MIRPVQHRSVVAVVIVTIGLFSVIDGAVIWIWDADPKFMPAPFAGDVYDVGGVSISLTDLGTIGGRARQRARALAVLPVHEAGPGHARGGAAAGGGAARRACG